MTDDPGPIYIPHSAWEDRKTGKTCAYIARFGGIDREQRRTSGLKVYRTLRLAKHARVYQIAAHALGLAPPVRSTIVEVHVAGLKRKRWGYVTAHADNVGLIPSKVMSRLCKRAAELHIPAFDAHVGNFGFYQGRWVLIDFAHPED